MMREISSSSLCSSQQRTKNHGQDLKTVLGLEEAISMIILIVIFKIFSLIKTQCINCEALREKMRSQPEWWEVLGLALDRSSKDDFFGGVLFSALVFCGCGRAHQTGVVFHMLSIRRSLSSCSLQVTCSFIKRFSKRYSWWIQLMADGL